jgi:hypothetical protein
MAVCVPVSVPRCPPAAIFDRGHTFSVLRLSEITLSSILRPSSAVRLCRTGGRGFMNAGRPR